MRTVARKCLMSHEAYIAWLDNETGQAGLHDTARTIMWHDGITEALKWHVSRCRAIDFCPTCARVKALA